MLIAVAGCGTAASDTSGLPAVSVAASADVSGNTENETGTDPGAVSAPALITDNGAPIWDFDEFVNAKWREKQKTSGASTVYAHDEYYAVIDERLNDILDNTDISGMSQDDGLYKTITLYRRMCSDEGKEERIGSIKKYLSKIESVKSLNDLYDIYRDERYAINDPVLRFRFGPDENGYNVIYFEPLSLSGQIEGLKKALDGDLSDPQSAFIHDYLNALGYSDSRLKEMCENAAVTDRFIEDFWQNPENSDGYRYYRQVVFEREGVEIPILDILNDLGYMAYDDVLMGYPGVCALLNSLYKSENVAAIRDHFLLRAAYMLSWASGYGLDDPDRIKGILPFAKTICGDVLASEYIKRYISDEVIGDVTALIEEIKKCGIDTVCGAEWFSVHGKELARRKLLRMYENIGTNGTVYDLSGVELTDDPVENYINVLVDRENFFKAQLPLEDADRNMVGADLFVVNAKQYPEVNEIAIFTGMLSLYADAGEMAYEEKLGFIGNVIAHEIAHSYDPATIVYESTGYYEPWLTDDEQKAYTEEVNALIAFLDNAVDEYGNAISGQKFVCETYSDILAVKICLNLLSEKENADYDLFFRTYAEHNALYYTEDAAESVLNDPHLPGKLRINYVLGQFDEFYETYEIDTNSPYYVPDEKRIKLFR